MAPRNNPRNRRDRKNETPEETPEMLADDTANVSEIPVEEIAELSAKNEETGTMSDTFTTFDEPTSEEVTPDETSEVSEEVTPDDNSGESEEKTEEKTEEKVPETPKFDLPADPTKLELPDHLAQMLGVRLLQKVAIVQAIDSLLRAQQDGDNSGAVIAYAESDDASENVKAILANYNLIKSQLAELMDQMTSLVKEEKGEVRLSEKEIAEKKEERTAQVTQARTAVKAFEDYVGDITGDTPEIDLFLSTIRPLIGARTPSAGKSGSSDYKQSTNVRPRLGVKVGGFVSVNGVKEKDFSAAVTALQKATGNSSITTGDIHAAWAQANGKELSDWANFDRGEKTFTFGEGEKQATVTVNFQYPKK